MPEPPDARYERCPLPAARKKVSSSQFPVREGGPTPDTDAGKRRAQSASRTANCQLLIAECPKRPSPPRVSAVLSYRQLPIAECPSRPTPAMNAARYRLPAARKKVSQFPLREGGPTPDTDAGKR